MMSVFHLSGPTCDPCSVFEVVGPIPLPLPPAPPLYIYSPAKQQNADGAETRYGVMYFTCTSKSYEYQKEQNRGT